MTNQIARREMYDRDVLCPRRDIIKRRLRSTSARTLDMSRLAAASTLRLYVHALCLGTQRVIQAERSPDDERRVVQLRCTYIINKCHER